MTTTTAGPPSFPTLLPPLLASLPSAAFSPQPPIALLPLLAPILRQRVQILSAASEEPWLPLLCYSSNTDKLVTLVKSEQLEPHPASGEVEIDWDNVSIRYRRLDLETLQARVELPDFDLRIGLVYCVGDQEGGGNGWRIGDIDILDSEDTLADTLAYHNTILGAEAAFKKQDGTGITNENDKKETIRNTTSSSWQIIASAQEDSAEHEDNDDAYWAQYDNNSSAPTPAVEYSPTPDSMRGGSAAQGASAEEAYYAQYEQVQPVLDNEDPDEAARYAAQYGNVESSLGREDLAQTLHASIEPQADFTPSTYIYKSGDVPNRGVQGNYGLACSSVVSRFNDDLAHPCPASSTESSPGSVTVARFEAALEQRDQNELEVRQHVATSIKSLYRLARATGIERGEFSRLVTTELELLGVGKED